MKFARTVHHFDTNSLECLHCGDCTELYRTTGADPHKLLEVHEDYEKLHSSDRACTRYANWTKPHELEREPKAQTAQAVAMHVLGISA